MKKLMLGDASLGEYPDDWVPPDGCDLDLGIKSGEMSFVQLPPDIPLTEDQIAVYHVDRMDRLQFEVLFDQENRLRAQESKSAITRTQYRAALIAKWKTL